MTSKGRPFSASPSSGGLDTRSGRGSQCVGRRHAGSRGVAAKGLQAVSLLDLVLTCTPLRHKRGRERLLTYSP
jgi:hypothetical protein